MTPNDKLRALMRDHNLTRRQVCDYLGLPIRAANSSNPRLDAWLTEAEWQNPMPPQMLELLQIKLTTPE